MGGIDTMTCPRLDHDKIAEAYKLLDDYMYETVKTLDLNYYEMLIVYAMMDGNIKCQNISQYLVDTVTRFAENEEKKEKLK